MKTEREPACHGDRNRDTPYLSGAGVAASKGGPMSYGHAERNLALIRQLEAETRELFADLVQPDQEQVAEPASAGN